MVASSTLFGRVNSSPWVSKVRALEPDDGTMRALTPRKRASAGLHLSDTNAQMALHAVYNGLYHHNWLARWRAIQVLRDTSTKGDEAAIDELLRLCRDDAPEVRCAAAEALEKVVETRGIRKVIDQLSCLCSDEFDCVRTAAVHAICRLGKLRCPETTELLVMQLQDTCADVRNYAVQGLSRLAEVGDEVATAGLVGNLRHCEEARRIQQHAMLAWKLANESVDPLSNRHVNTKGQSATTWVRLHAQAMLRARELETSTRRAAVHALERIAVKGHPQVYPKPKLQILAPNPNPKY
jgi:HEAT repeat protein